MNRILFEIAAPCAISAKATISNVFSRASRLSMRLLISKALDYTLCSPFGLFANANIRFGLRLSQPRFRGNDDL
ncbi:MAG: hypothetical protein ABJA62_03595 [Luteimonas sp.]